MNDMFKNDKPVNEYENIIAIIERGFNAINDNYNLIYGYIHKLEVTNPKQAAALELMVLDQIPTDYSIRQKIKKLREIMNGSETED
jgi:hypothetical protein